MKRRKDRAGVQPPASGHTLLEDIRTAAEWIVRAMASSGYILDGTVESARELDRFFDEQSGPDGILARHGRGKIIFSIGSWLGETAIRLFGGEWLTDDSDPQGEINVAVRLADGGLIFPVQRAMKRYASPEDGLYAYLYVLEREHEKKK